MNPQDQDPNAPAASPDVQASYPTAPQEPPRPDNDAVALQQIDAIESENLTPPQPVRQPEAQPAAPPQATPPQQPAPTWQPTPVIDPYTPQPAAPKPENKSKKLIITLAVVVFVLAAAVAGYFVWQSMTRTTDSTNTTDTTDIAPEGEQTGGDLPGGEDVEVTPGANDGP